jgi:hypothetical protein
MRSRIAANRFRVTATSASWKVIDPFRHLADVLRPLPTTPPDRLTGELPDLWFEIHPLMVRKLAVSFGAAVRHLPGRYFNLFGARFGNLSNSLGRKTAVGVLARPTGIPADASRGATGALAHCV